MLTGLPDLADVPAVPDWLDETAPQGVETREDFLLHLGRAKRWLNTTRRQTLLDACRSLPEHAACTLRERAPAAARVPCRRARGPAGAAS